MRTEHKFEIAGADRPFWFRLHVHDQTAVRFQTPGQEVKCLRWCLISGITSQFIKAGPSQIEIASRDPDTTSIQAVFGRRDLDEAQSDLRRNWCGGEISDYRLEQRVDAHREGQEVENPVVTSQDAEKTRVNTESGSRRTAERGESAIRVLSPPVRVSNQGPESEAEMAKLRSRGRDRRGSRIRSGGQNREVRMSKIGSQGPFRAKDFTEMSEMTKRQK